MLKIKRKIEIIYIYKQFQIALNLIESRIIIF